MRQEHYTSRRVEECRWPQRHLRAASPGIGRSGHPGEFQGECPLFPKERCQVIDSLRKSYAWSVKNGFALLLAFLLVGWGSTLLRPRPAVADGAVDKLVQVALSDVSLS